MATNNPNNPNNPLQKKFYQMFIEELRDIYNAENQIIEALPRLLNAVTSNELKQALKTHAQETQNQKKRLEKVFSKLNERPEGKICEGLKGILKECEKVISRQNPSLVEEAALIGALQKVEHYEIATYGTLRTFAKHLELKEIESILQEILDEEGKANKKLTKVAEGGLFTSGINAKAAA